MSVAAMTAAWRYSQAPDPTSLLILVALADWADDDGYCFPSHRAIQEKTGAAASTVKRAMRQHIKRGELERVALGGHATPNPREFVGRTGFKATNLYRITLIDKLGSRRPDFLARNGVRRTPVRQDVLEPNGGQPDPATGATENPELGPGTIPHIRSTRQIYTSVDTSENVQAGAAPRPPSEPTDEPPTSSPRAPYVDPDVYGTENVNVITKIVHETIDLMGDTVDDSDLRDALKWRLSSPAIDIRYSSGVLTKAIESARWQRAHRKEAHAW